MSLVASEVSFAYVAGREVLRAVAASFPSGSMTVVVGPNGAGKSTLLRLLLGVLRPASGSVTLRGEPVHTIAARRRAGVIGYVPQKADLAEAFSVEQVVRLGRHARPADDGAVGRALERMELADRADEPFGTLSAGQQQRATLARVLAQLDGGDIAPEAQTILADEPCAAMDPRHAIQAMGLLREQARRGRAVVMVLHDLTMAARFADRAVVLDGAGRVAAAGETDRTLTTDVLRGVFEVPFRRVVIEGGTGTGDLRKAGVALIPELPADDRI
jgi:iron complex transport system ATP-binding protein